MKHIHGAAQWVKGLAAKPDDLTSSPGSHGVEDESQQVALSPPYAAHMCTLTYTHLHT